MPTDHGANTQSRLNYQALLRLRKARLYSCCPVLITAWERARNRAKGTLRVHMTRDHDLLTAFLRRACAQLVQ
jgi:hypothetical protein